MITWHARIYNLRKYRSATANSIKPGKSGTRRSPGQPLRTGISRSQPDNAKMAPHLICPGGTPSFERISGSPVTESNRRPSPYHGDALPTELTGPIFSYLTWDFMLSGHPYGSCTAVVQRI